MKKIFGILVLTLAIAGSAYAHCGKCGGEADHKHAEGAAAHSGAGCPMHGDKNATLTEASAALQASNPDLAAKVKSIAENCCKKDAAKSEHPKSEHPAEHPSDHPAH